MQERTCVHLQANRRWMQRRGAPAAVLYGHRRRRLLAAAHLAYSCCAAAAGLMCVLSAITSQCKAGKRASALCVRPLQSPRAVACAGCRNAGESRTLCSPVVSGRPQSGRRRAKRGSESPMPLARLQESGVMIAN